MTAVGYAWQDDSSGLMDGGVYGNLSWLELAFWLEPYSDMRVRYDNGQLCTFRRKSPPQGGEG